VNTPKRAEIWWGYFPKPTGNVVGYEHPVLTISHYVSNLYSDAVTVLPLTGYVDRRGTPKRRPYGVLVTERDVERLDGDLRKDSLISCDQPKTIFTVPPSGTLAFDHGHIKWGPLVEVNENVMKQVYEKLDFIFREDSINGAISRTFKQGDVLTRRDGRPADGEDLRVLVVSSNSFNATHPLYLLISVPLQEADLVDRVALAPVVEVEEIASIRRLTLAAQCQVLQVLDESERFEKIGRITDLTLVLDAIRRYLGITMTREDKSKRLPPLSEEELIRSAQATREAGHRFLMQFRKETVEWFRRFLEREGDDLSIPVLRKPVLELLRSRVFSLIDFPRLRLEPAPVLGKSEKEVDVRKVSLGRTFDLGIEELERELRWCGPSIEIALTFTETEGQPVYSAYASEPTGEPSGQAEPDNTLVITLKGPNEQRCTARLSAEQKAAIFEGDPLPAELKCITVELGIQKE